MGAGCTKYLQKTREGQTCTFGSLCTNGLRRNTRTSGGKLERVFWLADVGVQAESAVVSGNVVVVSAPWKNNLAGAVYVFTNHGLFTPLHVRPTVRPVVRPRRSRPDGRLR
jgi:hypothetical protein